jgi:AAA+ ATPase superfamily predicted ATPase
MATNQTIIGRKQELDTLERAYRSSKSEFVIVYGRRRVGKTFLVNQKFDTQFTFRMTAIGNASTGRQLENFQAALAAAADLRPAGEGTPPNWFTAFQRLIKFIEESRQPRKVIFFDELPWFDTHGSDFLQALEHFWNSWASLRSDVLLIACGSAASWMVNQLIHHRGGLHNRITERILLQPFSLAETEQFLQSKGGVYDRYQLLEFYMAMGGVPFYLDNVQVNRSVHQNIDRMFFTPGGLLNLEYGDLYRSLFTSHERHLAVVGALAQKPNGLLRKGLLSAAGLPDGGNSSAVLDELEQSGFIKRYFPFGKTKRDALYQLIDPYTLFYLTFVRDTKAEGQGAWLAQLKSPRWRAWSGHAFEYICRYHVDAIKRALGIGGVYAEVSTWRSTKTGNGAQVDLLIDRKDRIINVCEIKFAEDKYTITKSYADNLRNKLSAFRLETGTNKTLLLTMITTFGVAPNAHALHLVQDEVEMGALFG